jgi:two-component system response regulator (stage 0 sporulation protein F)
MKSINLAKRRVIIADDEESNRVLMNIVLEQDGWEVSQAEDGQETLEKVLQWQPSVLILDYHMPKLTGAEVYQQLQLYGIKIAVVLVSSFIHLEEVARRLGIVYYLYKPFDITEFLKLINLAYANLIC